MYIPSVFGMIIKIDSTRINGIILYYEEEALAALHMDDDDTL
jgi:hypothetical protein